MLDMGIYIHVCVQRGDCANDQSRNAGLFLYIDLSPWLPTKSHNEQSYYEREFALAQRLLDAGVGVHPCEEHGEIPGHFRLVFSQDRDTLAEGLRRYVHSSMYT